LRDQLFEAVYCSNLRRASTTARAIADCFGIPLFCRPALREIDFGLWEGKRWDQIEEADPASSAAWIRSFPNLPAPEGEIFANFQTRVLDEAVRLFKEARNDSPLLRDGRPADVGDHQELLCCGAHHSRSMRGVILND
jgi:alpha-ribazole phosphatase